MKAARVIDWELPPKYIDVPELPPPANDQLQLKMLAAGVPRAVKGRAVQKHPSAFGAQLPFDPSADGVGLDETTGDMYFIGNFAAPLFAERANVDRTQLVKLKLGSDPVNVAALSNPTASSWMALQCRAIGGCRGRTVAIIGATSASGRAGVQVAHALGAARVIGIARNETTLADVKGLNERIVMTDELVLPKDLGPVDIVLDWVGGPIAIRLLQQAQIRPGENLQYIQTGGLAGCETLEIPARLINVKPIRIMASGIGSLSKEDLDREMPELVSAISEMKCPIDIFAAPMADVSSVWNSEEIKDKRLVLLPSE